MRTPTTAIITPTRAPYFPGGDPVLRPSEPEQSHTESRERIPGTHLPVWRYGRDETTGTPWIVEYVPTGQIDLVGNITAARRWTASGDAVRFFRDRAAAVVAADGRTDTIYRTGRGLRIPEDPAVCAARLAAARRHLAIHDRLMLPAGGTNLPDTECGCGGLLATRAGMWVHADACWECLDTDTSTWTLPCPTPARHHVCHTPEPIQCAHYGCISPNALNALPCTADHERCCGCCGEGRA